MHCDARALSLVSLVFGEVFFGGSPSLHDLFLHFLAKCFFCNILRNDSCYQNLIAKFLYKMFKYVLPFCKSHEFTYKLIQ